MSDARLRLIVATGLVLGAVLGMAGTFTPSAALRGVLWGIDGIALIVGTGLLTVHHLRKGNEAAAAGFLVFVVGETLVVSTSAMGLEAGAPLFGAGVGLWAASLALVSAAGVVPLPLKVVGFLGSLLFMVAALQIFWGRPLTPLSRPLPFFGYPFLAISLFGWAWAHWRQRG